MTPAPPDDPLERLVQAVQEGAQYRTLYTELVRRVAVVEFSKGRNFKETVKATRNKLHQLGGAYTETPIPYSRWHTELAALPMNIGDLAFQSYCRSCMHLHASTHERLPVLETFYGTILREISPVKSILDLACGLNPLAIPWMPLSRDAFYLACDIYTDQVDFLNAYLDHIHVPGEAFLCDLAHQVPQQPIHLALLLKTIPCLEQLDKQVGIRLLEGIQAEHILVSFPAHSLGGQSKGMVQNYEAHFREMIADRFWSVQRFLFPGELAFLISR
jgi:16S rRNA (guanine(1405)-N(7))-methyltransferase